MGHIQDKWNGTYDSNFWAKVGNEGIPKAGINATHVENMLRSEHGIPLRTHYDLRNDETRLLKYGTNVSLYKNYKY